MTFIRRNRNILCHGCNTTLSRSARRCDRTGYHDLMYLSACLAGGSSSGPARKFPEGPPVATLQPRLQRPTLFVLLHASSTWLTASCFNRWTWPCFLPHLLNMALSFLLRMLCSLLSQCSLCASSLNCLQSLVCQFRCLLSEGLFPLLRDRCNLPYSLCRASSAAREERRWQRDQH